MDVDDEIERALGRHRPAGPPPGLRARIVASGSVQMRRTERRLIAATLVAAAVALVALMLSSGPYRELRDLQDASFSERRARAEEIEQLVLARGGDDVTAARIAAATERARAQAEDDLRRRYDDTRR